MLPSTFCLFLGLPILSELAYRRMAVDTPGRALLDLINDDSSQVSLVLTWGMPSFRMDMALLAWSTLLGAILSRVSSAAGLAFSSPHRRRFGCGAGGSWGSLDSIVLAIYLERGSLPILKSLDTAIIPGGI